MNESQLGSQTISIILNLYLGIIRGIPNLLNILDDEKNSAYYRDVVTNDVNFTGNAVTVAADDISSRAMEVKLQQKGIPFIKVPVTKLSEHIKANGHYVFILREMDYERGIEAAEEVKADFAKNNRDVDIEKEEEEELERERTVDEPQEETVEEATEPGSEEDTEESPDEDEPEEKGKKKQKQKTKKSKTTSGQKKASSSATTAEGSKGETDRSQTERDEQARRDQQNRDDEKRQDEQRARDQRNAQEQQAQQRQEAEKREYEHQQTQNRQEKSEQEHQNREAEQRHIEEQREREQAQKQSETEQSRNYESKDQESADTSQSNDTSDHDTQKTRDDPGKTNLSDSNASKSGSSTYQTQDGGYQEQVNRNADRKTVDRSESAYKRAEYQKSTGSTRIPHQAQRGATQGGNVEMDFHSHTAKTGESAQEAREKGNWVTNTPGASGTKTEPGTTTQSIFGTKSRSGYRSDPKQYTSGQGPQRLGSGADIPTGNSGYSENNSRSGGSYSIYGMSNSAKAMENASGTEKSGNTGTKSETRQQKRENTFDKQGVKNILGDGNASATDSSDRGTIRFRKLDASVVQQNVQSGNFDFSASNKGQQNTTAQDKFPVHQKPRSIQQTRTSYHIRNVFAPENMRKIVLSSQRILESAVIDRETDGGRMAFEIMENVSPITQLAKRNLLANGAMQISMNTSCNLDILASAYAVKRGISLNEAKSEMGQLFRWDRKLEGLGEGGLKITMANDQALLTAGRNIYYDNQIEKLLEMKGQFTESELKEKLKELYALKNSPENFMSMLRGFQNGDGQAFANFLNNLKISDGLKKDLLAIPLSSLDTLKIEDLMKKYGMNKEDMELLKMLYSSKISMMFPPAIGGIVLLKSYFRILCRQMSQNSDAGRAFNQLYRAGRYTYSAYRAGVKLTFSIVRKFNVTMPKNLSGAVKFLNATADPTKAVAKIVGSKLKNRASGKAAQQAVANAGKTMTRRSSVSMIRNRAANHASNALKFLTNPGTRLRDNLLNTKIGKMVSKMGNKVSESLTRFAANATKVFWKVAAVILIIMLCGSMFSFLFEKMDAMNNEDSGMANHNFAADTEIVQEIITELTQKNEAFIADINDAANHRGQYNTTINITGNENVSFYESGAYNIVFRDAYGNELEPTHVDLNNTKAIVSMASKFMPYPFQKPSDNASAETKKTYEELKQHFKDYCYFLWAATHQISIEEYHPGNSNGVEGAVDNSNLATTLDKGKCDKDGTTIWLKDDFTKDIILYGGEEWTCDSCSDVPATGLGDCFDDLCTHGKDSNEHGGWRKTGNYKKVYNCHDDHNHRGCDHSEGDCYTYTCEEIERDYHWHYEWEWIYECGGHMGAVVYVTIGDLSRLPGLGAAEDVDYSAVGNYDTGESLMGSSVMDGAGVTLETQEEFYIVTLPDGTAITSFTNQVDANAYVLEHTKTYSNIKYFAYSVEEDGVPVNKYLVQGTIYESEEEAKAYIDSLTNSNGTETGR